MNLIKIENILFAFKKKPLVHAFIFQAGTSIGDSISVIANSGQFPSEKQIIHILLVGLSVGIGYIIKNAVFGSSNK